MVKYQQAQKELRKYAGGKRKKTNEYFFKTGKGEYGEGDIFIGVRVPNVRKVAKQFEFLDFNNIKKLLYSNIHEERLLALLILVFQSQKAAKAQDGETQNEVVKFYLQHKKQVNNWDLVDLSVHYILGQAILSKTVDKKLLTTLTKSDNLWERRMSIVATWIIIRTGDMDITLNLAKRLLKDKEDLIHKATGWMLREAWKKDSQRVEEFLIKNYEQLPRTTLRYAIERIEEKKRKRFLKGEF